jgi:hypothetical protein
MADPADLVREAYARVGIQLGCARCKGVRFFVYVVEDEPETTCVECGTKTRQLQASVRSGDDARSHP